ncbi:MAG TPA: porin family protein [Pyrinomonadaceae bacterium]
MRTPTRRLAFNLALSALLLLAAARAASAQSPCRVGFLNGAAPTIDGNNAGAEWGDASSITSGDTATTPGTPCFGGLPDQNGTNFPVRVLSKRYTRAGQNFIGFYVEVLDTSTSGPLSSGGLSGGERFVVMLDPNLSRGAGLGTTGTGLDYRISVAHAWQLSGSNITDAQASIADSNHTQCPAGVTQNWGLDAPAAGLTVAAQTTVGGYKFELEIPLSVVGVPPAAFPASEMGVAFVVINDFGTTGAGPNAGYVAFPNSIPVTTNDNPVTGCHASWRVPGLWATTSSTAPPPGQVTISRLPAYWSSSALNAFQCGASGPAYTYFPGDPCNVELKATPTNGTGSAQPRNFLFLWARHGTGDPLNYDVISLVENVNVAAVSPADVSSGLWTNVPANEPNHPCTRVYILPNTFRSDFDRDDILGITTHAQLMDMVAKYGLVDDNWAQKNISIHTAGSTCPTANCSLPGPRRDWPAAGVEIASLAPRPAGAAPYNGTLFESDATPRVAGLPVTVAARPRPAAAAQGENAGTRPPRVLNPGRKILMTPAEFKANSQKHVVVQVRSFETEQPLPGEPTYYRFARPTGGVIQMFPVEMFEGGKEIPFELEVSAAALPAQPAGERVVSLLVDLHAPQGIAQNVQVFIDTSGRPIRGDETRVVRGVLALPGRTPEGEGFRRWGLSLHAGATIPHGTFNNVYNPGPNAGVDLEYRLNRNFSLEAVYTFNRFRGETLDFLGQPFRIPDANLHVLSLNGKVYGGTSPVRPFFNFGGGVYVFGSGASTRGGLNVGGGLQFDLTPTVALDSMYNFHNVLTSGSQLRYSTAQGGVRFRF